MSDPAFVLVKSTNPYRDGQYGRSNLRFTRDWRPLEVDELDDRDVPGIGGAPGTNNGPLRTERGGNNLISTYTLAVLEADTFLAVKPATQAQVEKYQADAAANGGDKDATIEALQAKNADLEARLMRLEQAAPAKKAPSKDDSPSKS